MSISLSPKHGVNPAIPLCFFCNKPKNEIILAGRLRKDEEAPRNVIWDMNPCNECKGYMDQGIIVISIKDGEPDRVDKEEAEHDAKYAHLPAKKIPGFVPNPHRTGGWWVITEEGIRRFVEEPLLSKILAWRWVFIEDKVCERVGLNKGKDNE